MKAILIIYALIPLSMAGFALFQLLKLLGVLRRKNPQEQEDYEAYVKDKKTMGIIIAAISFALFMFMFIRELIEL